MIDVKLYKYLSVNVTLVTLKGIGHDDETIRGKKGGKSGIVTSATFSATGKNGKHDKQDMSSIIYMSDSYAEKRRSLWQVEKYEYDNLPSKKAVTGPKVFISVIVSDEYILKNADALKVDLEFISYRMMSTKED